MEAFAVSHVTKGFRSSSNSARCSSSMVNLRWSVSTPRNFLAAAANASSSVSGSFSTSFGAFGSGAASSPVSQISSIFFAILYLLPVPSKTCVESSTCASIRGLSPL